MSPSHSCHYYVVVSTVFVSPLYLCHHCFNVTIHSCHYCTFVSTMFVSPLNMCHHCFNVTILSCHYCTFVSTVFVSPMCHHGLCVTRSVPAGPASEWSDGDEGPGVLLQHHHHGRHRGHHLCALYPPRQPFHQGGAGHRRPHQDQGRHPRRLPRSHQVRRVTYRGDSGERWSRGRTPYCQSRERWFNPTYRRFETEAISSTPQLPVSV